MRLPLIDGQGNFGSMDGDPPAAMRYTESAAGQGRRRAAGRHRQGHGRLPAELRREPRGAGGPAGAVPEPAGQRRRRHRRRHGHQHPAAQSGRDHRRHRGPDRRPRSRPCRTSPPSSRARTSRPAPSSSAATASCRPTARAAAASSSAPRPISRRCAGAPRSSSPRCPTRSTRPGWSSGSPRSYREKKVEGIADLRDESDRHGVRVVIEVKREADPDIVLNQLFKFTLAADQLRHQHGLAARRPARAAGPQGDARGVPRPSARRSSSAAPRSTSREARERAHIVVGLVVAVANIDEVIALIRAARRPAGGQGRPDRAALAAGRHPAAGPAGPGRGGRGREPGHAATATGCPRSRPRPSSSCACSA